MENTSELSTDFFGKLLHSYPRQEEEEEEGIRQAHTGWHID